MYLSEDYQDIIIISLEHIIKNKEATNRLKDKVDVIELKKLQKKHQN